MTEPTDDSVVDYNRWREAVGLPPVVKRGQGRKKVRTVSLTEEAMDGLRFLAKLHGTYFGEQPSISALIEAIGVFDIGLVTKEPTSLVPPPPNGRSSNNDGDEDSRETEE